MALDGGIVFSFLPWTSFHNHTNIDLRKKVLKAASYVSSSILSCPKCITEWIVIYCAKHFKLLDARVHLQIL